MITHRHWGLLELGVNTPWRFVASKAWWKPMDWSIGKRIVLLVLTPSYCLEMDGTLMDMGVYPWKTPRLWYQRYWLIIITYREANEPMRPMSIFHFLTNDMTCATICVLVAPHSHSIVRQVSKKLGSFWVCFPAAASSCPWWGWRVRRPACWVRIGLESWRWDLLRCDLAICFEPVRLCSEDIGMCLCLDMSKKNQENGKWHKTTWLLKCSANV